MSITSYVLLGLLASRPRHGYDLKHAHDQRLPRSRPLGFGQLYATLGRLERDGLVTATSIERHGGPDRTTYEATEAGRQRLDQWFQAVEEPAPYVSSTLLAKVMVALFVAGVERATAYLVAQRSAHMTRLRELTAVKTHPDTSLGDIVAADYAVNHLDADLRWLSTTLDRVADLHREVHQ